ncbi:PepSY-associated TM helix domain-containing protein [Rheinheimera sp.]|uniref:PepSY-associated TM helix domain-containing protein n=1 Tax=Rheinheimera sp. TaxID=1869214 RepID=UPI00307D7723
MSPKKWFAVHSFAGFYFGWLMLLVCLSGTLAVVSHEIEYLSDAKFRASGASGPVPWAQLQAELDRDYVGYQILALELPDQPYLAGEISLVRQNEFLFVYFDPASGQLTGDGEWGRLSRYLRNLHMYLSMGDVGKVLVTALSFLLAALLVSSFYVYKQWWKGLLKWPGRLTLQKRTHWSDWHKWLGACSWPFILIITLTGLWYFTEFWLLRLKVEHYPSVPKLSQPADPAAVLPLAELVQKAQQVAPWLEVRAVNFPVQAKAAVMLSGQDGNPLYRNRANRVYLHPNSGEIIQTQRQGDLGLVGTLVDIADPLHFGSFAGLGVKLLYLLFGLALTFLVASGLWLHRLRTKRQQPQLARWYGLHGALCLLLVLVALAMTTANFSQREIERLPLSPVLGSVGVRS